MRSNPQRCLASQTLKNLPSANPTLTRARAVATRASGQIGSRRRYFECDAGFNDWSYLGGGTQSHGARGNTDDG